MATLDDTFNQAIQKEYYLYANSGSRIVKFTEYGSQYCIAAIFNEEGRLIDTNVFLRVDSKAERDRYKVIPYDKLPEPIKMIKRLAQTQPSCIELEEDWGPAGKHPFKKGGDIPHPHKKF